MDSEALRKRQEDALQQLGGIGSMMRGTITHQKVQRAGGAVAVYPLLSWKEGGKTCSLRLKSGDDVAWAERATANYRRFAQLVREYEMLGEQRALSERESGAAAESIKKSPGRGGAARRGRAGGRAGAGAGRA